MSVRIYHVVDTAEGGEQLLVRAASPADGLFKAFRFSIGERVSIVASGETGKVVGRAEFATAEPSYLIRYARADGVATEAWWPESALEQA